MVTTQVVGAHLPPATIREIDNAIERGVFLNRSDAIRSLLRDALTQRHQESER